MGKAGIVGGAPELPLRDLAQRIALLDFDPGWCRRNGRTCRNENLRTGCDVVGIPNGCIYGKQFAPATPVTQIALGQPPKRVTRLHDHAFQAEWLRWRHAGRRWSRRARAEGSRGLCNKNVWPAKWRPPCKPLKRNESIFRM